jgi:hypothetical protein
MVRPFREHALGLIRVRPSRQVYWPRAWQKRGAYCITEWRISAPCGRGPRTGFALPSSAGVRVGFSGRS